MILISKASDARTVLFLEKKFQVQVYFRRKIENQNKIFSTI